MYAIKFSKKTQIKKIADWKAKLKHFESKVYKQQLDAIFEEKARGKLKVNVTGRSMVKNPVNFSYI